MSPRFNLLLIGMVTLLSHACGTIVPASQRTSVDLPFIKNTADECYYLDEFMPVPDGLVNGRSRSLNLRYYTYRAANYKDWESRHVILSFYSQDNKCWSLFEEYYVGH